MARIDDYKKAVELGKKELCDKDPGRTADHGGGTLETDPRGNPRLTLVFLGKKTVVTWPECGVSFAESEDEVPIQQQVLILHYLNRVSESKVLDEWIAYQEIPDGKFYLDAFYKRAKNPMVQAFGDKPELLLKLAAKAYAATPSDQGDASVVVQAFPKVPIVLMIWRGDDEFPPEGNILFDRSISHFLSAEDIAWLAGMIIYPLMGMAKNSESFPSKSKDVR